MEWSFDIEIRCKACGKVTVRLSETIQDAVPSQPGWSGGDPGWATSLKRCRHCGDPYESLDVAERVTT